MVININQINNLSLDHLKQKDPSELSQAEQKALKLENLDSKPGLSQHDLEIDQLNTPGHSQIAGPFKKFNTQALLKSYHREMVANLIKDNTPFYWPLKSDCLKTITEHGLQIPLKDIPKLLKQAVTLSESENFLELNRQDQMATLKAYTMIFNSLYINDSFLKGHGRELQKDYSKSYQFVLQAMQKGECLVQVKDTSFSSTFAHAQTIRRTTKPGQNVVLIELNFEDTADSTILHEAGHAYEVLNNRELAIAQHETMHLTESVYLLYTNRPEWIYTKGIKADQAGFKEKYPTHDEYVASKQKLMGQLKDYLVQNRKNLKESPGTLSPIKRFEYTKGYYMHQIEYCLGYKLGDQAKAYAQSYMTGTSDEELAKLKLDFQKRYALNILGNIAEKQFSEVFNDYAFKSSNLLKTSSPAEVEASLSEFKRQYDTYHASDMSLSVQIESLILDMILISIQSSPEQIENHIDDVIIPKMIEYFFDPDVKNNL